MRLLFCLLVLLVSAAPASSRELKLQLRDGKKLTLHNWTLDGDTLRGTRDAWVDYEKVQMPDVFALGDVILRDGNLEGEELRAHLESLQRSTPPPKPAAAPKPAPPPRPVEPSRLRLRLADSQAEGAFIRSGRDSVWLVDEDTLGFARSSILQVHWYKGSTSASGTGAMLGGCVGLVSALGLIAIASSLDEGDSNAGGFIVGTVAFIGIGALVGTFVGSLFKKEKWVEATLPVPSEQVTSAPSEPQDGGTSP